MSQGRGLRPVACAAGLLLVGLLPPSQAALPPQADCNTLGDAGDTFASATPVAPQGTNCTGTLSRVTGDAYDYYRFPVGINDQIEAVIYTTLACYAVDLVLLDGSGSEVASSRESGCMQERISFETNGGGDWRIRVEHHSTEPTRYGLILDVYYIFGQNDCGSGRDVGNKIGRAYAVSPASTPCSGQLQGAHGDRNDFYKFYASGSETITITLRPSQDPCINFNLLLYTPDQPEQRGEPMYGWYDASSADGCAADTISLWPYAGWWRFLVWDTYNYDGAYEIQLDFGFVNQPPGRPSTPQGPSTLNAGETGTYSTSTTDPNGDALSYHFEWSDGSSQDVGWYASGETASATHSWVSPGSYCSRVFATDTRGATSSWSYCHMVSVEEPPPLQNDCGSNGDAGNDYYTATTVGRSVDCTGERRPAEGDNNDFYQFPANVNDHILATLTPTGTDCTTADMDLLLYDSQGNDLTANVKDWSRNPGCQTDTVEFDAGVGGNWRVRVDYFTQPTAGPYRLTIQVTAPNANDPPNPPSQPSPADQATNQPTSLTLSWTGGDPDGTSPTYAVFFDPTNPPTSPVCSGSTTAACGATGLAYSTTYYWRVRSSDGQYSTDGPVWRFTTQAAPNDNQPPNRPANPQPAAGATGVPDTPTLSWSGGDPDGDAVTYIVNARATTSPYWDFVCETATTSCSWGPLTRGVAYEWFVVARDSQGATSSSSPPNWAFTTQANRAPTACFTTSTSGFTVTVDAGCSSDADGDVLSYAWNWRDGSSTTGASSSHTYVNRGSYDVQLSASDGSVQATATSGVTIGPDDLTLATRYAPVFFHDTDEDDPSADEMTTFNFDGDWVGKNNWENEPFYSHPASVDYYVVETESDYYLGYMVFHPRDWTELDPSGRHENDMEGALVVIRKDGSHWGKFLAVHTMAHDQFHTYVAPGLDLVPGGGHSIDDFVTFWTDGQGGKHPQLGIEAKGHGMYNKESSNVWDASRGDFRGGTGIVYQPTGTPEVPDRCAGCPGNDRSVGYALYDIADLWNLRYQHPGYPFAEDTCEAADTCPFATYGAFRGDSGGNCLCPQNRAHAPWAMDYHDWVSGNRDDGPTYAGDWFEDPANFNDVYLDTSIGLAPFSHVYVYRSTPGVLESFHPYGNNEVHQWVWKKPGATSVRVHLARVWTEADVDSIRVIDAAGNTVWTVSGSPLPDQWSPTVTGDRVIISFVSNGAESDWGFYIDQLEWAVPP